jgi:chromosome segregation ATPase
MTGWDFRAAEWIMRVGTRVRDALGAARLREENRQLRDRCQRALAEVELERREADRKVDDVRAQCDRFYAGLRHQRDRAEAKLNRERSRTARLLDEVEALRDESERLKAALDAGRESGER